MVDSFVSADITDLSSLPDGYFDVVVCYGGALSYVFELRHKSAAELVRVVRPGGILLISVMSKHGGVANLVRRATMPILKDPEGWKIWEVVEDGDLPGFPSVRVNMWRPPMHMYTSEELRCFLPGCQALELAGSNVTDFEGSTALEDVYADHQAWETAVRLERELSVQPGACGQRQPHNPGRAPRRRIGCLYPCRCASPDTSIPFRLPPVTHRETARRRTLITGM